MCIMDICSKTGAFQISQSIKGTLIFKLVECACIQSYVDFKLQIPKFYKCITT